MDNFKSYDLLGDFFQPEIDLAYKNFSRFDYLFEVENEKVESSDGFFVNEKLMRVKIEYIMFQFYLMNLRYCELYKHKKELLSSDYENFIKKIKLITLNLNLNQIKINTTSNPHKAISK